MTLLVSLASYILASLHLHTSHIFTITTLSHYIILLGNLRNYLSSLSLHFMYFIQSKINELILPTFLITTDLHPTIGF